MCRRVKAVFLSANIRGEQKKSEDFTSGNTDVIVHMEKDDEHGNATIEKYVASFFTYKNIQELRELHMETGEYLGGKYFFARYMLLIDSWSLVNVKAVIHHLLDEGDFEEVFRKI